ncbi:MAG: type II toxin-antitoxin system VapC family toxin [Limisphaerales bacterium]
MAIPGVSRLFVDTNVLVYATDANSPWQAVAESALEEWRAQGTALLLSVQVLREYLAVTTRTAPGQTVQPDYGAIAANLLSFRSGFDVLEDNGKVSEKLEELVRQFSVRGRQVHDANIVATMVVQGLRELLTQNVGDFARFSPLITIHPLSPNT